MSKFRYWESLYWDGFSPESIEAKPFEKIDSLNLPKETIFECKKFLANKNINKYYITLEKSDKSKAFNIILWHINAFRGTTDSMDVDAGQKCFRLFFDQNGHFIKFEAL